MARFLFLRHTTIDATDGFSKGCFPKKSQSFDLSQIGVSQGKNIGGFCPGPGGILHPPSRLPLGSRDMSLPTGHRKNKKNEIISRIIWSTLQQESPPARMAGIASRNTTVLEGRDRSPQEFLLFKTRIAPRNIETCIQESPLVRQMAGCLPRIAAAAAFVELHGLRRFC